MAHFRWADEGACQDPTVCEDDAVREESCVGLNGHADREQKCKFGYWPNDWSDSIEPDECRNGAEAEFSCARGLNDQSTRTHLYEEEQWVPAGTCVDPDLSSLEVSAECGHNGACQNLPIGAACQSDAGFEDTGLRCVDIDECAEAERTTAMYMRLA